MPAVVRCLSRLPVLFGLSLGSTVFADPSFTLVTSGPVVLDDGWSEGGNWVDYDMDGDLDLFVPCNPRRSARNFLYRNDGAGNFAEILDDILTTDVVMAESGTWGDYDNDGDPDVFVANGGFDSVRVNFLYDNNGDGTFTKVEEVDPVTAPSFSTSSSWADIDNDGDLDLYCANLYPPNNPGSPTSDFLYENINGVLVEVTSGPLVNTPAICFGSAWSDYDNDGDADIFVTASGGANNNLFVNQGDGSFVEATNSQAGSIVSDGGGSISCSWGDYNNDGWMDIVIPNYSQNDMLYRNDGDGSFTRITNTPVSNNGGIGEGSAWGDYDNDGDLDLIFTNGGPVLDTMFIYTNLLIETGQEQFERVYPGHIAEVIGSFAGGCFGDYDNDGFLDFFAANFNGHSDLLYHNDGNDNHWLNIRCWGTESNRSAIGAKVRLKANINGNPVWQLREVTSQTGYNSQNSMRAHFGLGDATVADSVIFEWPSGLVEYWTDVPADQFLVATEGSVMDIKEISLAPAARNFHLLTAYPNPFNPSTTITYSLPSAARIDLSVYSITGQKVRTLSRGLHSAGEHAIPFQADNLASGVYVVSLQTREATTSQKLILTK